MRNNIKKLKNFLVVIMIFSAFILNAQQQNIDFKSSNFKNQKDAFNDALDNLQDGNDFYEQGGGAYAQALELFLKANKFNPNNAELNYKIGVCYFIHSSEKSNALKYYKKAWELDSAVSEDILYMIGLGYQINLEFDNAIEKFNEFRKTVKPQMVNTWEKKINRRIEECHYGKELVKNEKKILIENLGKEINSNESDHSPLISADESVMIFTSRRENKNGDMKDVYDNRPFEDIYISHNDNGVWSPAENIGSPINTKDHDATVGLSPDGQELFIYNGVVNGGDIYTCKIRGDKWGSPKALPNTINSPFHESSACFSFDGKTIYFVSNRIEDNLGGRDIYFSRQDEKGNWNKAKNIGPEVNTSYDETSVFMHPDGRTLFFSSRGHNSMGGYDIFKSVMGDDGAWSKPESLGYPVNTTGDDIFFVLSANGKHGYYASVRKDGLGDNDIYKITFIEQDTAAMDSLASKDIRLTLLKGIILDPETGEPIEATIEIIDNEKNEVVATFTSNSKTGKFLVSLPSGKNYGIAVKSKGYLFHSENFDIPKMETFREVLKNIPLQKVKKDAKIVLNNIFFDFARATIRTESLGELKRVVSFMKEYPTMVIEISGHTDNQSSLATNQKLSTERAKAVVDFLIENGIEPEQLTYKGYAFNFPIATNDTEDGRQLNRRVEFKIIKTE